jgi:hypothetical protein
VFLFPLPRGGDDLLDRGMLGFPAERPAELFLAGHENGGVAGAARGESAGNFAAGDFFGGAKDFEDGEASAVAHIEGFAGNRFDRFEDPEVGIGNVQDVDVVANAGAVGSGVVGAENIEIRNEAEGGFKNIGDEVSLDAVGFAALCGGASGVEIAERGVVETGICAIIGEDFFETEFRFAVGIDGIFGMVFGDRNGVRFAIGGGSGREDEFFDAVASDGVEEVDAGGDVSSVEGAGLADGLGDEGFTGEMHDSVDLVFGKDFFDLCSNAEIGTAEGRFGRDGGGVALLKIIESDYLVAASEENLRADAADVPCCSGDKNVQGSDLAF